MSLRHTCLFRMVLLLALLLSLPVPSRAVPIAIAQSTPGEMIEFLGSIGGSISALDVRGSFAYIGEGHALTILDIYDPARPVRLGTAPLWGSAVDIQVVGRLAYVIDSLLNLQLIDISDSSRPSVRARYDNTFKVRVSAGRAYTVGPNNLSGLLRIIDVSNPATPRLLGSYTDPSTSLDDVQVMGTIAYAAGSGGIVILDVGNPASPSVIGRYNGSVGTATIQLVEQRLYVAGNHGLQIIDVSKPTTPVLLGSYAIAGMALYLHVDGSHAYMTTANREGETPRALLVIDIANPAAPALQGFYAASGAIMRARVIGQRAYLAISILSIQDESYGGLEIVDLSDLSKPTEGSKYVFAGAGRDVQVLGNLAYVTMDTGGLQIVELDPPLGWPYPPTPKGSYTPPASIRRVLQVSDGIAYVVRQDVLSLIDVRDPAHPTLIQNLGDSTNLHVQVVDQLAYTASTSKYEGSHFNIWDMHNRLHPTFLGSYPLPAAPLALQVTSGLAYIGTAAASLKIIDVSDPSHPTLRGTYQAPEQKFSIQVIDTYVYIIDPTGTLDIIDVRDPANPTLLGSYPGLVGISAAQIVKDRAYLISSACYTQCGEWFEIIDLRDPTAPIALGRLALQPVHIDHLIVHGDRVYITAPVFGPGPVATGHIQVIDIRNPASPTLLDDYRMKLVESLEVAGDLIYANSTDYYYYSSLEIIDASDPSNLTQRAGYELPPHTESQMVVINDLTYVAGSNGLYLLNLHTDLLNATATITPEGGSLAALNGNLRLDVPTGAVASTTVMTYTGLLAPFHPVSPKYGVVRSFTLEGRTSDGLSVAQFGQPATLAISYTDSLLASRLITDEQHLNLLAWNGQGWVELLPCEGCAIDSTYNRVSVPVKDLTEYVLVGDRRTIFLPLISR